ncbi:fatty-acyl-CoA synthase [Poronia punctata]|nr:fatty-acyl-CoA synthase [Poronia punctata]
MSSPLGIAGAALGALAASMYLDARFYVRNDLSHLKRMLNLLSSQKWMLQREKENKLLIYHLFEERVGTPAGDNVFLIFEGKKWTYAEFYHAIQPIANWLLKDLGVKKGEVVLLDGGNTPEYLLLMFALEAIGATSALLNCNLTGNALVHSAKLSTARYILADGDVRKLVSPVESDLKDAGIDTYYYSPSFLSTFKDTTPLPKDRQADLIPTELSHLLYTSGTTGLPKGVGFSRGRGLIFGRAIGMYLPLKPGEVMYTCLPLYHASALALCTMPVIFSGAAISLGRKFSHSTFWPEVRASRATLIQYVGELCRYLINAPPSPDDTDHQVRMAFGNGMRPDVWERFRQRFGIECINELYGASDGMNTTLNPNRGDFTANALALRGPIWWLTNTMEKRIQVDPDTLEIKRGKDGWAIEAKGEDVGEIIVKMDPKDPDVNTPQYFNNRSATEKRRISNVFSQGDLYFRSGDLFRSDSQGRLFFVDRLGDTFRWHSENVSTNEVSDVVGSHPSVAETNVYGVLVPHADGRAGCAAIVPVTSPLEKIDGASLANHCLSSLPRYAVPLFLRVTDSLDYTGTHKLQKQKFRVQGIDLDVLDKEAPDDRLFWLPPGTSAYVPFTREDWGALKAGKVRL